MAKIADQSAPTRPTTPFSYGRSKFEIKFSRMWNGPIYRAVKAGSLWVLADDTLENPAVKAGFKERLRKAITRI